MPANDRIIGIEVVITRLFLTQNKKNRGGKMEAKEIYKNKIYGGGTGDNCTYSCI